MFAVDTAIQHLNNRGQEDNTLLVEIQHTKSDKYFAVSSWLQSPIG